MQLQSNPSTGYRWESSYDNSSIMLVNRTYIASNATLPGAPGADVFTFQGTTTGTSLITFNNIGPSNQTVNNVTYTITCTALNVPTGNAVLVSSGQNFTLQQPSNPSTGYQWNATYDNSTFALVNQTFVGSALEYSTCWGGRHRAVHLPRNSDGNRRHRVELHQPRE